MKIFKAHRICLSCQNSPRMVQAFLDQIRYQKTHKLCFWRRNLSNSIIEHITSVHQPLNNYCGASNNQVQHRLELSRFEIFVIVFFTSMLIFLQGYSYVAPSIIFTDNSVSSDLMQRNRDHQPDDATIWTASHFKVRLRTRHHSKRTF